MSFSSTIQILKINDVEKGVSRKTGQPWERHTAECLLLADDGSIECVGRLMLPEAIRTAGVTTGTFRAGFTLHVPTYGDSKGDITARLVSLTAAPTRSASAPAAAAAAAAAAKPTA